MGRSPCCTKEEGLNRGPWTALEDKILIDFVTVHGVGNWRKMPKEAGLKRCGKSCRLRWLNYLRPGIKRGSITAEEEDLIIRLHNLLGNRWALIAGRLPGRTDNEVKNYWNSCLRKKVHGHDQQSSGQRSKDDERRKNQTLVQGEESDKSPSPAVADSRVIRPKVSRCSMASIAENPSKMESDLDASTQEGLVGNHEVNDDYITLPISNEESNLLNFAVDLDEFLISDNTSNPQVDTGPYQEHVIERGADRKCPWDHLPIVAMEEADLPNFAVDFDEFLLCDTYDSEFLKLCSQLDNGKCQERGTGGGAETEV